MIVSHRNVRLWLAAALAAGLIAPVAAGAKPLSSADTNGDGQISRDEAMAAQDASFKRLDKNGDGVLDHDEFDAGQPQLAHGASPGDEKRRKAVIGRWFKHIDTNGNDKITPAEYRKAVAPYFDRLDSNHDGQISRDELRDSFQQAAQAQQQMAPNKPQ